MQLVRVPDAGVPNAPPVKTTSTPSTASFPAALLVNVVSVAWPSSTEPTPRAVVVDAVIPETGKLVQLVSVPELGVPSTGVVKDGEVMVWTPVNVFAASVRANVALVVGNVMVVPSVPANVNELLTVNDLPEATIPP